MAGAEGRGGGKGRWPPLRCCFPGEREASTYAVSKHTSGHQLCHKDTKHRAETLGTAWAEWVRENPLRRDVELRLGKRGQREVRGPELVQGRKEGIKERDGDKARRALRPVKEFNVDDVWPEAAGKLVNGRGAKGSIRRNGLSGICLAGTCSEWRPGRC